MVAGARGVSTAGCVTVRSVRVLLNELLDGLNDFTVVLQVFPEGDLAAVNNHFVVRGVELLTSELSKLGVYSLVVGSGLTGRQVIDVLKNYIIAVKLFNKTALAC